MPVGGGLSPSDCQGQCATDTATYILEEFNRTLPPPPTQPDNTVAQVVLASPVETLRRATLLLGSRLPTDSELSSIRNARDAQAKEQALSKALDKLLDEQGLFIFLDEALNNLLLTDRYLLSHNPNTNDNAISIVQHVTGFGGGKKIPEFENREWYSQEYSGGTRGHAIYNLSKAIAKENSELVKFIVKHNRPFTEMLTANYMMMNWFSAKSYGLIKGDDGTIRDGVNKVTFKKLPKSEQKFPKIPYDPADFRPIRNTGSYYIRNYTYDYPSASKAHAPHAGVLSSVTFLSRYDTTKTNRNRHRSRIVMDYFLNTDILAANGEMAENPDDLAGDNPTLNNPKCAACHNRLDPIASAFHNWESGGKFRPTSLFLDPNFEFHNNRNYSQWSHEGIKAAGFSTVSTMPERHHNASLQWLAQQIVANP